MDRERSGFKACLGSHDLRYTSLSIIRITLTIHNHNLKRTSGIQYNYDLLVGVTVSATSVAKSSIIAL